MSDGTFSCFPPALRSENSTIWVHGFSKFLEHIGASPKGRICVLVLMIEGAMLDKQVPLGIRLAALEVAQGQTPDTQHILLVFWL